MVGIAPSLIQLEIGYVVSQVRSKEGAKSGENRLQAMQHSDIQKLVGNDADDYLFCGYCRQSPLSRRAFPHSSRDCSILDLFNCHSA